MGGSSLKSIAHQKNSNMGLELHEYGLWTQGQWIIGLEHQRFTL